MHVDIGTNKGLGLIYCIYECSNRRVPSNFSLWNLNFIVFVVLFVCFIGIHSTAGGRLNLCG